MKALLVNRLAPQWSLLSIPSIYRLLALLVLALNSYSPLATEADWALSVRFPNQSPNKGQVQSQPQLWLGEAVTLHLVALVPTDKRMQLTLPESPAFHFAQDKAVLFKEGDQQGLAFPIQITPLVAGSFTLPALTLSDGVRQQQTPPIQLNVVAPNSTEHMSLSSELSHQQIYLGQSIRLTTTWLIDYPIQAIKAVNLLQPELLHPNIKVYSPWNAIDSRSRQSIGLPVSGRRLIASWKNLDSNQVQIQFTQVLKPEQAGNYQFPPASLTLNLKQERKEKSGRYRGSIMPSYFDNNFFETNAAKEQFVRVKTQAKPLSFVVKPLPAGAPAHFSGIVGKPLLSAQASPTEVVQGQPIQYTLKIQHPDIEAITLPPLQKQPAFLHEFKLSTTQAPARLEGSVKTIHQNLFPNKSGTQSIPSYRLSYFDPESGRYDELQLPPIEIEVAARETFELSDAELSTDVTLKNEVNANHQGIWAHKWGPELAAKTEEPSHPKLWHWLLVLPPALILFLLAQPLWLIRQQKQQGKPLFRFKQNVLADGEGIRHFTRYCQERLALPPSQCYPAKVAQHLAPINADLSQKISQWMSDVEQSYGTNQGQNRARLTPQATQTILELLQQLEHHLEKSPTQASAPSKKAGVLSALLATSLLCIGHSTDLQASEQTQHSLEQLYQEHKAALQLNQSSPYEAKKRHTVIAQKLVDLLMKPELDQVGLMYNIGTSWLHAGRMGHAILWLNRAAALAPNDQQIQHNLRKARGERLDALPRYFAPAWYAFIYQVVSHSAWFWVSILLYLWLCYSLYAWVQSNIQSRSIKVQAQRKTAFTLAGALLSVALLGLLLAYQFAPKQSEGVITAKSVETHKGPNSIFANATSSQLHQGTEFILLQQREGWLKIELSSGLVAWVPQDAAELFEIN